MRYELMNYEVDAIYSNGTFVPVTPVPLPEGMQVHLRVEKHQASVAPPGGDERPKLSRAEMADFLKMMAELPVESPDDGFSVEDHDKVIYRLP
jgi:predicted DNA-binding antitoxin AbrB/MazE fold protein